MLKLKHIELKDANEFVAQHHRHHKPVTGHRFSIACYDNDRLCGVAIIGRPVARKIDQVDTVEALCLCTDGTHNACSFLYAASKRAAKALGYKRIITYILQSESGVSLAASGWECINKNAGGGSWNVPFRPRTDKAPTEPKKLYESILN